MTNRSAGGFPHSEDLQVQARTFANDSWVWVQSHWLNIALATGAAILLFLALHAVRAWALRLCRRGDGVANWYAIIGRALGRTGNFFIIMASIRLVTGYANPPQMVTTTIQFLFTIAAVFQVAIWVREIVFGAVEHRTASEDYHGQGLASALGIIRLLVSIVVFAIAFVVVLSNLGVNVTGLVAGLGVGGIAIGLAAQGIFADLFAALAILFDKPFRVGDKIRFDGHAGIVQSIGLKSTRVRAFTGEELVIANKKLLDMMLENLTNRHHVRIKLMLGLAYETAPDKLEALPALTGAIVEAAGGSPVRASLETFNASTVDFALEFDVEGNDQASANVARDKVMIGVLRRFAEEGITLAFPCQTTYTADPTGRLIMPYPDPPEIVLKRPPES